MRILSQITRNKLRGLLWKRDRGELAKIDSCRPHLAGPMPKRCQGLERLTIFLSNLVYASIHDSNDEEPQPASLRIESVTTSSFDMRRMASKEHGNSLNEQVFHWIALETGSQYPTAGRTAAEVSDDFVTVNIAHYRDSIPYNYTFAHALFALDQSTNDGDPAVTDVSDILLNTFRVRILEEKTLDLSQTHSNESVGFIDFENDMPLINGTCVCETGFTGAYCAITFCNGVQSNNESVCTGRGSCVSPESCECSFGWNPETFCSTFLPPVALLEASDKLGLCDNLQLDGIRSYSRAGFDDLIQYVWTSIAGPNHDIISNFLVDNDLENRPLIIIPSDLIDTGTHTLGLTIFDGTGLSSETVRLIVAKSDTKSHILSIEGSQIQSIAPSQGVRLRAYDNNWSCAPGDRVINNVNFSWKQIRTNAPSGAVSIFQNSLYIPPYTVAAGSGPLHFQVDATFEDAAVLTRVVSVKIVNSPVVVRISGSDRQHPRHHNLELDIFSSVNYNLKPSERTAMFGSATIDWDCARVNSSTPCGVSFPKDVARVTIPANSLSSGEYFINVKYEKGGFSGQDQIQLSMVDGLTTLVSIVNLPLANANERLILQGIITPLLEDMSIAKISWIVLTNNLVLDSSTVITENQVDETRPFIVFRENALTQGSIYKIKLQVVSEQGNVAHAISQIRMNDSPHSGTVQVAPSSGRAFETTFSATAYQWTDTHLPLQYQYEYFHPFSKRWEIYQSFSPGAVLGAFSVPFLGLAQMRLLVKDALNATSTYTFAISVSRADISVDNPLDLTTESGTTLQLRNNIDFVNHELLTSNLSTCDLACEEKHQEYRSAILTHIEHTHILSADEARAAVEMVSKVVQHPSATVSILTNNSLAQTQHILGNISCNHELDMETVGMIISVLSSVIQHAKAKGYTEDKLSKANQESLHSISCLKKRIHQRKIEGEVASLIISENYAVYVYKDLSDSIRSKGAFQVQNAFTFEVSPSLTIQSNQSSLSLAVVEFKEIFFPSDASSVPLSTTYDVSFLAGDGDEYPVQNLDPPNTLHFTGKYEPRDGFVVQCQFFDVTLGRWMSTGCTTVLGSEGDVRCECSHLTSFSIFEVEMSKHMPLPPEKDEFQFYWHLVIFGGGGILFFGCIGCCLIVLFVCIIACFGLCFIVFRRRTKVQGEKNKERYGSIKHAAHASTTHKGLEKLKVQDRGRNVRVKPHTPTPGSPASKYNWTPINTQDGLESDPFVFQYGRHHEESSPHSDVSAPQTPVSSIHHHQLGSPSTLEAELARQQERLWRESNSRSFLR